MNRKRVIFHYDSEPDNGKEKLTMNFRDNLIIANDEQTAIIGPTVAVLGYAPASLPLVAAKECLEEMLALVNSAMDTE